MRKLRKLPDTFLASQVDDELILVHGHTGGFFALKDVGLEIWKSFEDEAELGQICDHLVGVYDVSREVCETSVASFADQLVEAGFADYA
ncbi:MAG: PqqD family protein [Erythrobacter sp.]